MVAKSASPQPWHMILHCGKVSPLCLEGISSPPRSTISQERTALSSGVSTTSGWRIRRDQTICYHLSLPSRFVLMSGLLLGGEIFGTGLGNTPIVLLAMASEKTVMVNFVVTVLWLSAIAVLYSFPPPPTSFRSEDINFQSGR